MPDTRRKTGPTPTRRAAQAAVTGRWPLDKPMPWDMPETAAQTERIRDLQGGGRGRARRLFAGVPHVTVLRIGPRDWVRASSAKQRARAARPGRSVR
jgi:hypothetical protein